MTLQSVEVRNSAGVLLGTMPVGKPTSSQDYYIKDVDGLGPTDAVLALSTFADYDGSVYHGGRLGQRNIVLSLGYSPNYKTGKDVGALRKQAYIWFRPKTKVQLTFNDSDRARVYSYGYVEKVTPDIFSKTPSLQVSLISEEAYFASRSLTTIEASANSNVNLSVYGDAPSGFIFRATAVSNFGTLTLINGVEPNIVFTYPFATGDQIIISTKPGSKYASVTRAGTGISLLDRLSDSTLQMFIDNSVTAFRVNTSSGSLSYSLEFRPKWSGV